MIDKTRVFRRHNQVESPAHYEGRFGFVVSEPCYDELTVWDQLASYSRCARIKPRDGWGRGLRNGSLTQNADSGYRHDQRHY
ncbi:MAG: hypothetical protein OTJ97_10130 [SAR202 cluster bacterium]|nr:hypothetical protein [SAR202 cluster bacterium]